MGKASRDKGKRGERELAAEFRQYGFSDAHRTAQHCGRSGEAMDVVGLPFIHVECKRVEKLNLSEAMGQAIDDCKPGNLPAVFHRKNGEPWVVSMTLDDWMNLYREFYSGKVLADKAG